MQSTENPKRPRMKATEQIGKTHGRLTVLILEGKDKWGHEMCWAICSCGKEIRTSLSDVYHGHTKSCGCLQKESVVKKNFRHGHTTGRKFTGAYGSWSDMVKRCTNPNTRHFKNYVGRGITISPEWMSFENFLRDMGDRPEGLTIERINNSEGYKLGNCRWATMKEQARNRRRNLIDMDKAAEIRRLKSEGLGFSAIVRQTGYPKSSVNYVMYRDGWN